ncbi:hypothetical protein BKA70DRAFT_1400600 [Coprinopsis sp. MPI-PUGE-AT-0042]|nr:hypothetical protein BKA70DRAFT_1400600 [Coprinopsis sp. MPI-PUGE-AT-0042]
MKIVKFITSASKKLAKVESWKFPLKGKTPPALPAPPVDEGKVESKPVVEEKAEMVEDRRLLAAEGDVPPPKPAGKRKALLIGIQFYPDPEAEAQEPPVTPFVPPLPSAPSGQAASAAPAPSSTATPPTPDAATRTTPSLAASSSVASITSRAEAKTRKNCAAAVSLRTGLSSSRSAWAFPTVEAFQYAQAHSSLSPLLDLLCRGVKALFPCELD